jgi:hypothetical protein
MVWRMNRDRRTFTRSPRWFPSRGNVPRTSVQPVPCLSALPGLIGGEGRGARPRSRPRIVPPQPVGPHAWATRSRGSSAVFPRAWPRAPRPFPPWLQAPGLATRSSARPGLGPNECLRHRAATPDAYRTAPRGATSTTAIPRAYSTTSRSPCLQRSTPESSANVETTWSTISSSVLASRSSYATSMLSPLMSRTRSTMPSVLPHTRRASPLLDAALAHTASAPRHESACGTRR